MSAQNIAEGRQIVSAMLESLAGCQEGVQRARTIHATLLELIDVPLNWNNLEATVDRLAGFARGLANDEAPVLEIPRWPSAVGGVKIMNTICDTRYSDLVAGPAEILSPEYLHDLCGGL